MISREDVNALQNIGRKAGMNVPAQDAPAFSRRLGTVVQVYDDGRLDVNMNSVDKPSVQYGLRMTTACRGVAVNDVVVVDVFAHVPLVTGVIAHDSSHYVKCVSIETTFDGSDRVYITAPKVDGYQFVCWVATASIGWVGLTYIDSPEKEEAIAWTDVSGAWDVKCTALYVAV